MSDGQPDYVAFGQTLQRARLARGLTIEDIARHSKIPPTLISALEGGQAERFPNRIFLLNYIRSYAAAVGAPADGWIAQFDAIPEAPQPEPFDPHQLEQTRRARATDALWSTIAAVALAVAALTLNGLYELALRFTHR